jgi:hypothetical protein
VGGIDLAYTTEKLVTGAKATIAKGYQAVKIKLGQPTLSQGRHCRHAKD